MSVRGKTSRFRGVSLHHSKWMAVLWLNGRTLSLGRFGFETDAAIAYNYFVAYLGLDRKLNVIPADQNWHD
jgi:hypothetical protein